MKNKIVLTGFFFVLMAALPLFFAVSRTGSGASQAAEPAEQELETLRAGGTRDPAAAVAALCEPSFSDEAIKAAAVIQRTNEAAGHIDNNSGEISDKELYERAKVIYDSVTEILQYSGKPVRIPSSPCSNGFTSASDDYEYLEAVASPWDAFSPLYDASLVCEGVSMNGIAYLCGKGLSAEEALIRYLPRLEIRELTR